MIPPLRLPLASLLLACLTAVSSPAAELKIVRILTDWRDADSFHRLSEYFGSKENDGGIKVLRSQPADHNGYYWLIRLKNQDGAVAGAKFELKVISPASPEPKTFTFAADIPSGGCLFQIGLTGSDWPGDKARPDAWHLSLLAADGTTLLARESYLWELPAPQGAAANH
jgi:hypothetical protein